MKINAYKLGTTLPMVTVFQYEKLTFPTIWLIMIITNAGFSYWKNSHQMASYSYLEKWHSVCSAYDDQVEEHILCSLLLYLLSFMLTGESYVERSGKLSSVASTFT